VSSQGIQTLLAMLAMVVVFLIIWSRRLLIFMNRNKSSIQIETSRQYFELKQQISEPKELNHFIEIRSCTGKIRSLVSKSRTELTIVSGMFLAVVFICIMASTENKKSLEDFLFSWQNSTKHMLICRINENVMQDYILAIMSLALTLILYLINLIKSKKNHEPTCTFYQNYSKVMVEKTSTCSRFGLKRLASYFFHCSCGLTFPVPMNPFCKHNRFIVCVIFAAYFYTILNIFKTSVFNFGMYDRVDYENESEFFNATQGFINEQRKWLTGGILKNFAIKILYILVVGFHFYPLLLCVEFKLKSTIGFALCMCYAWIMLFYYVLTDSFCDGDQSESGFFNVAKSWIKNVLNKNDFPSYKQNSIHKAYEDSRVNPLPKVVPDIVEYMYENLTFYATLSIIAFFFALQVAFLLIKDQKKVFTQIRELFSRRARLLLELDRDYYLNMNLDNEMKYVQELATPRSKYTTISYFRYNFETYVYKSRQYFRFSKQFLSTQFIVVMLLFFLTTTIVRNSSRIFELIYGTVVLLLDFIITDVFKQLLTGSGQKQQQNEFLDKLMQGNTTEKLKSEFLDKIMKMRKANFLQRSFQISEHVIMQACIATTVIYAVQILVFIKRYQTHVLNAYKGLYLGIPSPKKFKNSKIVSCSMRYW
jgi:hypothetical protein